MSNSLPSLLSHPAIWRASRVHEAQACLQQNVHGIASGFSRLDRELPDGGWPHQGVLEMLLPHDGLGELGLLAPALARLSQQNRWLVWIAPPWIPYAPALERQGVNLQQVLLVQPSNLRDCLWSMEQCLSSGACSAVLGWPGAVQPLHVKRLHLAAQHGQCMGVLMREQRYSQSPSPAPLRIEVGPVMTQGSSQMQCNLRLIKRRGRWASEWFSVQWEAPIAPHWPAQKAELSTPSDQHQDAPASRLPKHHDNIPGQRVAVDIADSRRV